MIPFFTPDIARYSMAVAAAVEDSRAGPGKECTALAEELCEFTGAKYCLLTSSGTVGLQLAAAALGLNRLKYKAIIAVPDYGAVQTVNAFAYVGYRTHAREVSQQYGTFAYANCDIEIDAVCHVDFCGRVREELLAVRVWCDANKKPMIEDAACALLSEWSGVKRTMKGGRTGDIGVFSFSGPKPITGGQGGALITDSEEAYKRARGIVNHGLVYDATLSADVSVQVGTQARMSDLSAALIRAQLKDVDRIRSRLLEIESLYAERLDIYRTDSGPAYHYIIRSHDPRKLIAVLKDRGIEARRNYLPLGAQHGRKPCVSQGAARWWNEAVYLPFGPGLRDEQVKQVCEAVLKDVTIRHDETVH